MKKDSFLFEQNFLKRFSAVPVFLSVCGSLAAGIVAGAIAVKLFGLLDRHALSPLLFSAVPSLDSGFLQCFSDILLNNMIFLIAVSLLGATAFGALGVPLLMFYKGVSIAAGALFILSDGSASSYFGFALCFTPVWSAAALLLTLFATRAITFSKELVRAGGSHPQETLDFRLYIKDFVYFLCFSVPVALAGGLLASLYALF